MKSSFERPVTRHEWAKIKSISGVNGKGEVAKIADNYRALSEVQRLIGLPEDATARLAELTEERVRLTSVREEAFTDNQTYYDGLYEWQHRSVKFFKEAKRAICADPLGAGKTVQSLNWREGRTLVVASSALKGQWADEVEKFFPGTDVKILVGTAAQRQKIIKGEWDILIVGWEQLAGHSRLAKYGAESFRRCVDCKGVAKPRLCQVHPKELNELEINSLIVDEVHRAKNPKALTTRALQHLAQQIPRVLLMTGTPMSESPLDAWSLNHILYPDEWSSSVWFRDTFCESYYNGFADVIAGWKPGAVERLQKEMSHFYLRRPASLILSLPGIRHENIKLDVPKPQRDIYDEIRSTNRLEGKLVAASPMVLAGRLTQAASCELKLVENKLVMSGKSNKVDELLSYAEELGEESLVVFGVNVSLIQSAYDALDKAGYSIAKITGKEDEKAKTKARKDFDSGLAQVLLCSYGAGAAGLNLTKARLCVTLQRPWSWLQWSQMLGRLHRLGQTRDVLITHFISDVDVEWQQLKALESKTGDNEEFTEQEIERILSVKNN